MANGNGARTWIDAVRDIGFPSAICLILLGFGYYLSQEFLIPLKDKHIELIDYLRVKTADHAKLLEEQTDSLRALEGLQSQTCELLKANAACNDKILEAVRSGGNT